MAIIPCKYYVAIEKNTVFWRILRALRHPALRKDRSYTSLQSSNTFWGPFLLTAIVILLVLGLSVINSLTCIFCSIFRCNVFYIHLIDESSLTLSLRTQTGWRNPQCWTTQSSFSSWTLGRHCTTSHRALCCLHDRTWRKWLTRVSTQFHLEMLTSLTSMFSENTDHVLNMVPYIRHMKDMCTWLKICKYERSRSEILGKERLKHSLNGKTGAIIQLSC